MQHPPMLQQAETLLAGLAQRPIVVVGDIMLDRYHWGRVERLSPEAPVPVVELERTEDRPGGAANVALSLHALGANVMLVGGLGEDEAAASLRWQLRELQLPIAHLFSLSDRPTTLKTRVLGNQQQLIRLDREQSTPLPDAHYHDILDHLMELLGAQPAAVVLQDYDKGFLGPELLRQVIQTSSAKNIPVLADPKARHFFDFGGVSLFKPNRLELARALDLRLAWNTPQERREQLQQALHQLHSRMPHRYTTITLGAEGALWYEAATGELHHYASQPLAVRDVSGAGDVVIATLAAAWAAGLAPHEALPLAVELAGWSCTVPGVAVLNPEVLRQVAANPTTSQQSPAG